jgi:hypothetical protein
VITPSVDRLGKLVEQLGQAYDVAEADLRKQSEDQQLGVDPLLMRDSAGRYILAELLTAYVSAYATWVELSK